MEASAVVCTYAMERYDVFVDAVESVLDQSYDDVEVVLVVDGNPDVYERVSERFGDQAGVIVHNNEQNRGISYSRTKGAELASGEVVLFLDDDAVADSEWVREHVRVYEETDAIAVAGPVEPDWVEGKPDFFPPEFYWLVGCTERGFASDGDEIRNGYGSNVSYLREAFLSVGGYDENTGRKGDANIQAHEPPVSVRLFDAFGKRVWYTEGAVVWHTLFAYRGSFRWLVHRSFWQGYSKRIMDVMLPEAKGNERDYLKRLVVNYGPERLWNAVRGPSLAQFKQFVAMVVFTVFVGMGYLYGITKSEKKLLRE